MLLNAKFQIISYANVKNRVAFVGHEVHEEEIAFHGLSATHGDPSTQSRCAGLRSG